MSYVPQDVPYSISPIDFSDGGTAQRLPVVLCLDTSSSMQGEPIEALNTELTGWSRILNNDLQLSSAVDVALVTFGAEGVRAWRGQQAIPSNSTESPFVPGERFTAPKLTAGGVTPMIEALRLAISHVRRYKESLRANGLQYYRPLIFLATDGAPTGPDGHVTSSWREILPELAADREEKRYLLYALGVGDLPPGATEVLASLAPGRNHVLAGLAFRELLQVLSASIDMLKKGKEEDPFAKIFPGQRPAGSP
ncbi:vWA domain-containing protein [Sphaerimonospora thailandensis]|uniref:VWFA domain-containing protein n=1 Tax=Sphaerimonospora thailandensis TaxID=795644 RepID=A0A8J3W1L5_9ACTN|nr:hypothetical protein [Sphaerimonospora thailandensis]GIH72320.1 hypothetical protein Mth01_45730 [Sphaerimonospora thailandensis]